MVSTSAAAFSRVVCYLPGWMVYAVDIEAVKLGISRSDLMRRWLEPRALKGAKERKSS